MSDAIEAIAKLRERAEELDNLSRALADVSRQLEPIEQEYHRFVDTFELGLLTRSEDEDYKLPSAPLRLKLAHKAMDPSLLGRYMAFVNSRSRLEQRIRDLKYEVEAQRSILSALKLEIDATR